MLDSQSRRIHAVFYTKKGWEILVSEKSGFSPLFPVATVSYNDITGKKT